jgi:hypothetical protein
MCNVCERAEAEGAGGTLLTPSGAVAQLVERSHGMAEVARSIRVGSTGLLEILLHPTAAFLGGFIAGEGCFSVRDGGRRFVFSVEVAARDAQILETLRDFLGAGSITHSAPRREGWQPEAALEVTGRRQNLERTVPFMLRWLPESHKREQFATWHALLVESVEKRPFRTAGRCSVTGCERPIRGRGLCRHHYYRVTGY